MDKDRQRLRQKTTWFRKIIKIGGEKKGMLWIRGLVRMKWIPYQKMQENFCKRI